MTAASRPPPGSGSARPASRGGRFLRAAALLLLAAGLAGCSSLRKGSEAEAAPAADAEAPLIAPLDTAGPGGQPARYRLEVVGPEAERTLLAAHLDLARFQDAAAAGSITRSELTRLVAAAPAQARALLETEGYFNAEVTAAREGEVVKVRVTPGPRAQVERVTVLMQGDLQAAQLDGDPAAASLAQALQDDFPLRAGDAFTQKLWSDAKNTTLARLRAQGYPLASWSGTSATVSAGSNRVRLFVAAESGPLARLGELEIRGLSRYGESAIRNLVNFKPGEPYSETTLAEFQERLQKAGLFETASVTIRPDPANAAAVPVQVRVRESQAQQATFGVGISANTGPRFSVEHTHRKLFGRDLTAKNTFEIGSQLRSWEGQVLTHPLPGLYRNLVAGGISRLDQNDEVLTQWHVRAGRTQDSERIDRLYYLELLGAKTRNPTETRQAKAATLNYNMIWRRVDSILLPTRGLAASAEFAGGYAFASSEKNGPFGRVLGKVIAYVPLGQNWYSQLRVQAGEVIADDAVGVPDTLLFRAGGDESVRGYDYRSLGPRENGEVVSGRVLFTSSAEIARPVSAKLPDVWWAAFVDAGQAADRWQDMKLFLGYGVGVRYRSPVGPLRVDLAYGQEVRSFRIHLSVGITL